MTTPVLEDKEGAGEGYELRSVLNSSVSRSVVINAAYAAFGIALSVILARSLGPAHFGVYSWALSVLTIITLPAQSGLPQLIVRETAVLNSRQQWGLLKGLLTRSNQAVLIFSVLLSLVLVFYGTLYPTSILAFNTILWGALLVPFIALGKLRSATLQGLKHVVAGQIPEVVTRIVFIVLALSWLLFDRLTAPEAMSLHAGAAFLGFTVGVVLLIRKLPTQVPQAVARTDLKYWSHSVVPLSLIAGSQVLGNHSDIVILGFFVSDAQIGIYRVAWQFAAMLGFVIGSVNVVIAPHIASAWAAKDKEKLQYVASWSAALITTSSLAFLAFVLATGRIAISVVFGDMYQDAYVPMIVLCVGQLANAGCGSVALLLNMSGNEKDTSIVMGSAAILNVVGNIILIPYYGVIGAAIASSLAVSFWNVVLFRKVRLKMSLDPSIAGLISKHRNRHRG